MNRRDFITAWLATTGGAVLGVAEDMAEAQTTAPEFYELRRYDLRGGPMASRLHDYLRDAALPACNRAGATPVGAFTPQFGGETPAVFLLLPFKSIQDVAALEGRLSADTAYQSASEKFSNLPAADPPYLRIESQLMVAFEGMPRLETPAGAAHNRPRIFELRTYESHSLRASRTKLEMFGKGGELDIFRRIGLTPVFFGVNLIGRRLPRFTYMLVYDDLAAREKNWATFAIDPAWKKLRETPGYTDAEIVTNVSAAILRPTPYSQV